MSQSREPRRVESSRVNSRNLRTGERSYANLGRIRRKVSAKRYELKAVSSCPLIRPTFYDTTRCRRLPAATGSREPTDPPPRYLSRNDSENCRRRKKKKRKKEKKKYMYIIHDIRNAYVILSTFKRKNEVALIKIDTAAKRVSLRLASQKWSASFCCMLHQAYVIFYGSSASREKETRTLQKYITERFKSNFFTPARSFTCALNFLN
ncbi:hypothetical protein PUN28_017626 [Cardiocondyla obscurior]|uniref:Uncharacterized protein n=1 Tax=Cardiocondyla obscurior TaxID=286306 RepID=A0AAW2EP98_9HYME